MIFFENGLYVGAAHSLNFLFVLAKVSCDDCQLEHLVYIEVFPFLARGFCHALQRALILRLCDIFQSHRIIREIMQVTLGQSDYHWNVWANLADLSNPFFHIFA